MNTNLICITIVGKQTSITADIFVVAKTLEEVNALKHNRPEPRF